MLLYSATQCGYTHKAGCITCMAGAHVFTPLRLTISSPYDRETSNIKQHGITVENKYYITLSILGHGIHI
jgi:hypothetical protein